jgi:membrane-bound lytic murein transglycosylase B
MDGPDPSPPSNPAYAALTLAVALLAGCTTPPTKAPSLPTPSMASARSADPFADADRQKKAFERWVTDFRIGARAAGIDEVTLDVAFADVRYLPRVVDLDRAQPEFTRTVWSYLDSAVSPRRIALGQDKWLQARAEIDAAAARYGVAPAILVAIWGMESNYGSNAGSIPTVDALATLGFEGRREGWARGQLLATLRILQNAEVDRSQMIGSWAGAMGQTQFLPSVYLGYAVDADGDGRRDIWGSVADAMASTANFLARSGWQADQPWGVEVRLPAGFDVGRADVSVRQSSALWTAEGVRTADGAPLPQLAEATVLLPAGARGPAFLVGPNFEVILRYNNSTSYALAVGLLAQRLAGGPDVHAPWPRDLVALSRQQLNALQTALNQRGFDSGTPDGVMGPATRVALRGYQRSVGLPADGYPTLDLLQRLQAQ